MLFLLHISGVGEKCFQRTRVASIYTVYDIMYLLLNSVFQ